MTSEPVRARAIGEFENDQPLTAAIGGLESATLNSEAWTLDVER